MEITARVIRVKMVSLSEQKKSRIARNPVGSLVVTMMLLGCNFALLPQFLSENGLFSDRNNSLSERGNNLRLGDSDSDQGATFGRDKDSEINFGEKAIGRLMKKLFYRNN